MNNTHGILQAYTRNILIKTDGLEYHEPYILPDTTTNKSSEIKSNDQYSIWSTPDYFTLYPNPAGNWLTIEYKSDYYSSNLFIEIISLTGSSVKSFRLKGTHGIKVIDLRNYTSGTYIVILKENGKVLQSAKFVKY